MSTKKPKQKKGLSKTKIKLAQKEMSEGVDAYKKEIKKLPTVKKVLKTEKDIKKKAKDNFNDPDLMNLIQKELGKGHIGDEKEILLTFLCASSSRLPPKDRVSEKVVGETSVGKTDMVKVCLKHFPIGWYAEGSRFTRATLEDDIELFDLIVILEKTKDDDVGETLKQISEDGMKIWKKDKLTNTLKDVKYIPRKSLIDTSTSNETDEEVANRAIIAQVSGDTERYRKVIEHYAIECTTLKKENHIPSWIKMGLKSLKNFDDVIIPFAPVIPFNHIEARMQRDTIRFLSLLKTVTWLNQNNRHQIEYDGSQLLIATPEDFWWTAFLSENAFLNSISGMNKKFEDILKAIKGLEDAGDCTEFSSDGCVWVKRVDVMHVIGIKTEHTIRKRTEEMKNLGILEFNQVNQYAPNYVRRVSRCLTGHPLMSEQWLAIFDIIKTYEKELLTHCLLSVCYPINNLVANLKCSIIRYNNNKLVVNNKKISNIKSFDELVGWLRVYSEKMLTKNANSPRKGKKEDKKDDEKKVDYVF